MRRIISLVVVVGVVAVGGVAVASTSGGASDQPTVSAAPSAAAPAEAARAAHPRRRHAIRVLRLAAKTIGIEPKELREAIRGGQTVAEVAEANGVDPQAVVDALVTAGTERLTTRVEHFVNETGERRTR
jgi:hypothetical protein